MDVQLIERFVPDEFIAGEMIREIRWTYHDKNYVAYSYSEAVDELENLEDGGRQRAIEAEHYRRDEEYVFGDQNEEP
jgi:hypothetical protein